MAQARKESAAKKFKKLVTEGPEDYRKKYEGKSADEINAEINEKVERKIHDADKRREERWCEQAERRADRLNEKMARYDERDWHKPVFMRRMNGHGHVFWRVFWGMLFVVAAAAVVLSAFNVFTFGVNIGWVVLGIFLAAMIVASLIRLNWFGVFMPAAGILTIIATTTNYLNWSGQVIGATWITAVLLTIGFGILFHRRSWYRHIADHADYHRHHHSGGIQAQVTSGEDSGEVHVNANFGSTIKYVNSDDFKHATLESNFGSIQAYFDDAKIQGKEAVIEINGSFSGFKLFIPRQWSIVNNLHQNLSGVEDNNPRRAIDLKDEKTVTLVGSLSLSGVEIIYI